MTTERLEQLQKESRKRYGVMLAIQEKRNLTRKKNISTKRDDFNKKVQRIKETANRINKFLNNG